MALTSNLSIDNVYEFQSFHLPVPYSVQSMDYVSTPTSFATSPNDWFLVREIRLLNDLYLKTLFKVQSCYGHRLMSNISYKRPQVSLFLSRVVNPILTTQLPSDTSYYTQSPPYERSLLGQQVMASKYRLNIQGNFEHLKSQDIYAIATIRLSLTYEQNSI